MKTLTAFLALTAAALTPAHAEIFRPSTTGGALLGGIAGAIIGHNSGDLDNDAWKGAAIGAVAGGLLGSAVGHAHDHRYDHTVPVPAHPVHYGRRAHVYHGYPYARYHYGHRRYFGPGYVYHPAPRYVAPRYVAPRHPYYGHAGYRGYDRSNAGLLLGGIAGAVIGHNSGDLDNNAWRGAAIGAGAGWLLGTVAERRERARERDQAAEIAVTQARDEASSSTSSSVPQTIIINNNYYGPTSPMSSANSAFGR